MAPNKKYIDKQITKQRKNLELIELRKSEYVQAIDIPLQLIKTEEETRAKLEELETRLQESEIDPGGQKPFPRWLMAAGAVVALVTVALLLWRNQAPSKPFSTLTGTTLRPSATTVPAKQTASASRETLSPPRTDPEQIISFPPLPEVAPALTTTVLLLSSPLCEAELSELKTFLADATNDRLPPVVVDSKNVRYRLTEDRPNVRSLGERDEADLVIWCTSNVTDTEIHFEALTQRATPEVYEPPTISMPLHPIDRNQRAALGIIDYLRRDYQIADSALHTTRSMSSEYDVTAVLDLLIGNGQVFHHAYADAVATYRLAVAAKPDWAFAWHNLGVAELYSAWISHDFDSALASFEKARVLDPAFDLSLISMARIYRWTYDEVPGGYEQALADCTQAEESQNETTRSQGMICEILTASLADAGLPQISDRVVLEDAATSYWAEPLAVIGIMQNFYWSVYHDQTARQQAHAYYERYLHEAYDDVHLEESRQLYMDVVDSYFLLQNDFETRRHSS